MASNIRFHIRILILYVVLLPIATALAGLVGDVSFVNYISLAYVLLAIFANGGKVRFKKKFKSIYLYFGYFALSMLWCSNISFSWYIATSLMNTAIIVFALSDNFTAHELSSIKRAYMTGFMLFLVAAVFNIETALKFRLTIKVFSRMDSNDLACGLLIIISILLEMLTLKQHTRSVILALSLAGLVIILSGSRGAMLMFLGVLIWWVVVANNRRSFTTIILLIGGSILLMTIYDYLPSYIQGRLDLSTAVEDGGSGRLKIWDNALKLFVNSNPIRMLIGYGYSSFKTAVNYVAEGHSGAYESHNIFINALIEGGIIGLFLLGNMLIQSYRIAKSKGNISGMLSVVGVSIAGCTLDMQAYRIFSMVFIVAVLFERNIKYDIKQSNSFRNNTGL